jgi:hypothetical protein
MHYMYEKVYRKEYKLEIVRVESSVDCIDSRDSRDTIVQVIV